MVKLPGYAVMVLWACGAAAGRGATPVVPFQVGEKLDYRMFWGPVLVGEASLEVRGIEPVAGQDCYHLLAEARTAGIGRLLFAMDSATESWLDVRGLFTRRFREHRVEGAHVRHSETDYDYEHRTVITRNLKNGHETRRALAQPVQDIISCLYYVRCQLLALDAPQSFILNASDTNFTVTIRPDERRQLSLRPVGEVPALRIEPSPTLRFVAANHGRMWFWISDDARHLPLIVTSTMVIGSAKLVLYKVESAKPALPDPPRVVAVAR